MSDKLRVMAGETNSNPYDGYVLDSDTIRALIFAIQENSHPIGKESEAVGNLLKILDFLCTTEHGAIMGHLTKKYHYLAAYYALRQLNHDTHRLTEIITKPGQQTNAEIIAFEQRRRLLATYTLQVGNYNMDAHVMLQQQNPEDLLRFGLFECIDDDTLANLLNTDSRTSATALANHALVVCGVSVAPDIIQQVAV